MKKIIALLFVFMALNACKDELDCCVNLQPVNVTLKFTHNWDGVPVTSSDFNQFKFVNENGETISIEKLRYVVSNINIGNNKINHHLVNIGEDSGLELVVNEVLQGSNFVKFTFGFSDDDNVDGIYQDLNSVNFGVPLMLGGGYHYMQFDGKYKVVNNADANFNYHAIRAADSTNSNPWHNLMDTSFEVDLGTFNLKSDTTIEIKMNIAEWFKNPNTWNLNELNTVLMPNFEAQRLMNANGKTVFSLGDIN
ncbi:MbnP family protein [Polaribacter sp. R77954]|uniref:MbnP family protein n=1 Tax=Polaribacter sp. R77954 TaxID=3093870 RepID=UPI0037C7F803